MSIMLKLYPSYFVMNINIIQQDEDDYDDLRQLWNKM